MQAAIRTGLHIDIQSQPDINSEELHTLLEGPGDDDRHPSVGQALAWLAHLHAIQEYFLNPQSQLSHS